MAIYPDFLKSIESLKAKFTGITFVGQAICHHTIGPFIYLKDFIDVKVYAECVSGYRGLDVATSDLKIESIGGG